MIDIPYTKVTAGLVTYCLLVYCLVCFFFYRTALNRTVLCKSIIYNKRLLTLSLLFLLSVITFCLSGDYFAYQEIVRTYNPRLPSSTYGEPVYQNIIEITNKNYLLFRLIVWGGAEFLLLLTFKRFRTNRILSLFIFYVLFIKTFFYARVSLAMAIYFYGLSFIIVPFRMNGTMISKVLGITIALCSFFFHSSMAICILATFAILIPYNKKTVTLIVFLFLLLGFSRGLLINLLASTISSFGSDLIINKMSGYAVKELDTFNLAGLIRQAIDYSRFFLPLLYIIICFFDKRIRSELNPCNYMSKLFRLALSLVIISAATILLNLPNNVLFYRILFFSMIPIAILVSLLYSKGILSSKKLKACLYLGMFVHIYDYVYAIVTGSF